MSSVTLHQLETWNLDQKFLDQLTRRTDDHPESRLDRVLDNICIAIDDSGDFLNFIPDSPFPARSLVQALGQLIKVGAVHLCIDLCHAHTESKASCRLYLRLKQMYRRSRRKLYIGSARLPRNLSMTMAVVLLRRPGIILEQ
jgi:hypothetical protein